MLPSSTRPSTLAGAPLMADRAIGTSERTTSTMRKPRRSKVSEFGRDDILPEYDFSAGRPNKYAEAYGQSTNIVRLDPDVAELFPDSASVNEALRALGRIAQRGSR